MKKKNGFTLIEIMGAISIIVLLSIIAVPIIEKNVKKGKEQASEIQIKNIELAAQNWVSDNKAELATYFANNQIKKITLKELIENGYMENETIQDPINGKEYSLNYSTIEITYISKNNYNYKIDLVYD